MAADVTVLTSTEFITFLKWLTALDGGAPEVPDQARIARTAQRAYCQRGRIPLPPGVLSDAAQYIYRAVSLGREWMWQNAFDQRDRILTFGDMMCVLACTLEVSLNGACDVCSELWSAQPASRLLPDGVYVPRRALTTAPFVDQAELERCIKALAARWTAWIPYEVGPEERLPGLLWLVQLLRHIVAHFAVLDPPYMDFINGPCKSVTVNDTVVSAEFLGESWCLLAWVHGLALTPVRDNRSFRGPRVPRITNSANAIRSWCLQIADTLMKSGTFIKMFRKMREFLVSVGSVERYAREKRSPGMSHMRHRFTVVTHELPGTAMPWWDSLIKNSSEHLLDHTKVGRRITNAVFLRLFTHISRAKCGFSFDEEAATEDVDHRPKQHAPGIILWGSSVLVHDEKYIWLTPDAPTAISVWLDILEQRNFIFRGIEQKTWDLSELNSVRVFDERVVDSTDLM